MEDPYVIAFRALSSKDQVRFLYKHPDQEDTLVSSLSSAQWREFQDERVEAEYRRENLEGRLIMEEDVEREYLGNKGLHPSLPSEYPTTLRTIGDILTWMYGVRKAGTKLLEEFGVPVPPFGAYPRAFPEASFLNEFMWFRAAKPLLQAIVEPPEPEEPPTLEEELVHRKRAHEEDIAALAAVLEVKDKQLLAAHGTVAALKAEIFYLRRALETLKAIHIAN
jgi:hypothetical protein